MNEQLDSGDIEGNLSSLDRWVEAVKDVSLVSVGIIASYVSLAYGSTLAVGLAFVILAVSILSSIFLPYKVAVTKSSLLGIFSRYRSLELMAVIVISWVIPTSLILSDLVSSQLPPQSESRFVEGVLTIILPTIIMLFVTLLGGLGFGQKVFGRVGFSDRFFEKYEKYPWGSGGTSLFLVSFLVVKAQLLLLEAVQTYAQSPELAVSTYARAFGPIVVLILLCCTLTYFEPERVLTMKGELIFAFIGAGVLVALVSPVIGFLMSLAGVLVLLRYSSSLPPLDVEAVMSRTETSQKFRELEGTLLKLTYPRGAPALYYTRSVLFVIGFGGLYLLLVLAPVELLLMPDIVVLCITGGTILYFIEGMLKLRLVRRAVKLQQGSKAAS